MSESEYKVWRVLQRQPVLLIEDLVHLLPECSWCEVFVAIKQLTNRGAIQLVETACGYQVMRQAYRDLPQLVVGSKDSANCLAKVLQQPDIQKVG